MNERLLLSLTIAVSGCCFTPSAAPTAPAAAPPAAPPPAPITTVPGSSMEACLQLCERFGRCLDTRGAPRTPETADCTQACTVGHTYASLPPQAYVCASQPTCVIFESCLNAAIGAAIAGMPPGGIPAGVPTPPTAPPSWPDGFPVVPGGTPVEAPPAGPVRVALLMYSIDAAQLDAQYHDALSAAGWTATATEAGPEARRFSATRGGASVSVSIIGFEGGATIQTMQF